MSRPKPNTPQPCAEPGCKSMGQVRVTGNAGWFCFQHKPVGAKLK